MPAKRDKAPRPARPPHNKRLEDAYCAQVISIRALRHFIRRNGGGQRAVAWLAGRQLSVVTRAQLYVAGFDRWEIEHRAANGSLHRRHLGVYLVGSPIAPPGGGELAALFACGDNALISHRSAAVLWGLLVWRAGPIDVTVVARNRREREGIDLHRAEQFDHRDRGVRHGIAVTAPARTLIDLAVEAEDDELEAAVSEARALRLIKDGELERALERAGSRSGVTRIRRLLRHEGEQGYTRSKAERLMRRLARDAALPRPLCNGRLHGHRVDFLWPEQRLVVEVDGYQWHGHRSAFERDRRKDQVLLAAGYRVVRITWRQLNHEPLRVAAVLSAALTASRVPG